MRTFLIISLLLTALAEVHAATTVDAVNRYAYGGNFGWVDWVADTNNGAVIGEYVCSGNLYSANIGWICLGSGSPANQIQYQNNSATDYGVNQDGLGNLTGYAYGANVGWIAFEQTYGQPKVDLFTGKMSGYAWSGNCGWIALSNSVAYVQTDGIQKGALDRLGLPIAWELTYFGHTGVDPNADPDGDGMNNLQEYLAGTDPNNSASMLKITYFSRDPVAAYNTMNWSGVSTRFYAIQTNSTPTSGVWADRVAFTTPWVISASWFDTTANNNFYRIRAFRPLTP